MEIEEQGLLPHTETPQIPFLSQQTNLVKLPGKNNSL